MTMKEGISMRPSFTRGFRLHLADDAPEASGA